MACYGSTATRQHSEQGPDAVSAPHNAVPPEALARVCVEAGEAATPVGREVYELLDWLRAVAVAARRRQRRLDAARVILVPLEAKPVLARADALAGKLRERAAR